MFSLGAMLYIVRVFSGNGQVKIPVCRFSIVHRTQNESAPLIAD